MRTLCLLAVALLLACNGDDVEKDQGTDAPATDGPICKQPPDITYCHKPPNIYSQTLWFCEGCGLCSGGPPTKACNGMNGDCREFYDTCIPKTYIRCNQDAPDSILGLCGDCFFREGGTIPDHCNKLIDAGLVDVGGVSVDTGGGG